MYCITIIVSFMKYKSDYHIHTNFSDGKAAPEEYVASAIASGISEIGFSDHLTLYKGILEWSMIPDNLKSYLEYMERLKSANPSFKIKIGLEIDFIPGKEEEIRLFLDKIPDLDYRIGSVHYLGEKTVDTGPDFYEGKNIDRLFESYFDYAGAAVSSGLFDILGHCDYIRIYGFKPSFNPEPLYRKLAMTMYQHNVVLEVNTNGKNKPVGDFYPDSRFLRVFREENVPVCVNSDAHFPARVGQYFNEAYQLVRDAGYTEMALFSSRERTMVKF